MENNITDNLKEIAYVRYDGRVEVDTNSLLVSAWNSVETGGGSKIYCNEAEFFEKEFDNPYDAAWAASAGDYRGSDRFVYFDTDGRLTSFSELGDDTCPIDIDKIDINSLIKGLQEINKGIETGGNENNSISRAIQDALQEV